MVWTFIRSNTDEGEGRYDLVYCILDETSPIRILDTNYELSLIVSRPEICIQSGTQVTDMEVSSWGWSETRSDSHIRVRNQD